MNITLISIIIAIAGYSVQNISQVSQKIGILTMEENRRKGLIIWAVSTVGTGLSAVILLAEVSLGQVSLVGAMAGTGLVSMTIFSRLVMKEPIRKNQIIGIITVLLSAMLVGVFAREASASVIAFSLLLLKLIIISAVYSLLWIIFKRRQHYLCIILGGFSGALGGFVSQFQKISASVIENGRLITAAPSELESLFNPFTFIWILISICSMTVLQFAHKNGRPMRVIPMFAANYILVPVIGGVTCFGESLHLLQWFGVGGIIIGVIFITLNREKTES